MVGEEMWAPPKWAKPPKFGKAVKCGNGGIFDVLVSYVLVYLFRHVRGNVGCERWSLPVIFLGRKQLRGIDSDSR